MIIERALAHIGYVGRLSGQESIVHGITRMEVIKHLLRYISITHGNKN